MNETSDENEPAAELVMPFTVVASAGGPYDDNAFAAGWLAGAIDAQLAVDVTEERWAPTALVPQLDLVAMRHGYTLGSEPWDEHPEQSRVWFARAGATS